MSFQSVMIGGLMGLIVALLICTEALVKALHAMQADAERNLNELQDHLDERLDELQETIGKEEEK